ncbi:hypothetical protein N499_1162A, partial [Wolbachia pipientis wVitA]
MYNEIEGELYNVIVR